MTLQEKYELLLQFCRNINVRFTGPGIIDDYQRGYIDRSHMISDDIDKLFKIIGEE